jgi:hypothetical protein
MGHFSRNFVLFQSPLGPTYEVSNEIFGVSPLVSNIIRNISLHTTTGDETLTKAVNRVLYLLHVATGQDLSDPRTTYLTTKFHFLAANRPNEDEVGNPIHLLGIIITTIYICLLVRRSNKEQLLYYVCLIAAFIIFCAYLKWQPWHSRLHLPLFILWMPLVSAMLAKVLPRKLLFVVATLSILYAGYWTVSNVSRPLSIDYLQLPRAQQYFQIRSSLLPHYIQLVDTIVSTDCHAIGLLTGGDSLEYPVWALLKNKKYEARLEHIFVTDKSAMISVPAFEPCLIVGIDRPSSSVAKQLTGDKANWLMTQFPVEQIFGSTLFLRSSIAALRQVGPMDNPLVIVDSALVGVVGIAPDLQIPSWGIEIYDNNSLLWLGYGQAEGIAGTLWATQKQTVQATFKVEPGPARPDPQRTVELSLTNATGTQAAHQTFDRPTTLTFTGELQPGRNDFNFKVLDEPTILEQPNGETRPILVLLHQVTIKPF